MRIQQIFKQIITIDEFGFSSREQIYAKVDELQDRINSGENTRKLTEKLAKIKDLISVYEEVVEGNYIDNLIKEQQKMRQTAEQRSVPAQKPKLKR